MKEPNEAQRKAMARVAKALVEVPVDKKRERDALHARLRQKYAELEPLKSGMSKEDLNRFEEIGEIIELLEKSEGSGRRPWAANLCSVSGTKCVLSTLLQHGAAFRGKIAMIKITGSPLVKTRLPLTAWVLAGLVTLFSMVSSLVHVAPASDQALSVSEQVTVPAKKAHQASVSW